MKKIISLIVVALFALTFIPCSMAKATKRGKKSAKISERVGGHHKTKKVKKSKGKKSSRKRSRAKRSARNSKKSTSKSRQVVSSGDWKYTKLPEGAVSFQAPRRGNLLSGKKMLDENIHMGMTRSYNVMVAQVALVQSKQMAPYHLNRSGKKISNVDGNYGPITAAAIEKIQEPYNIDARGRYILTETRKVIDYILVHNGALPPVAAYKLPEIRESHSTHYHKGEKYSDKYTESRLDANRDVLNTAVGVFAGTVAVDPEWIPFGSLIIVRNAEGVFYYRASDTGLAVIKRIASRGRKIILDFYGTKDVVGEVTIVRYLGRTAYQDLDPEVKKQMCFAQNWKGNEFKVPAHMNKYQLQVARR